MNVPFQGEPRPIAPLVIALDKRTELRRIDTQYTDSIYQLVSNNGDSISGAFDVPKPFTPEIAETTTRKIQRENETGEAAAYVIMHDNNVVGSAGLYNPANGEAELTMFVDRKYGSQGIGRAAAAGLICEGLENLGLDAITMNVLHSNAASRATIAGTQDQLPGYSVEKVMNATPASANYELWEITKKRD